MECQEEYQSEAFFLFRGSRRIHLTLSSQYIYGRAQVQRGAEGPNRLLVWGPKTLKTLMVFDLFECERALRNCIHESIGAYNVSN